MSFGFRPGPLRYGRSGGYGADRAFDQYLLSVAWVTEDAEARELVQVLGQGLNPGPEVADLNKQFVSVVGAFHFSALRFTSAEVKFDGRFSIELELSTQGGAPRGWAWLLSGPTSFFGFEPDSRQRRSPSIIYLPRRPGAARPQRAPGDVTSAVVLDVDLVLRERMLQVKGHATRDAARAKVVLQQVAVRIPERAERLREATLDLTILHVVDYYLTAQRSRLAVALRPTTTRFRASRPDSRDRWFTLDLKAEFVANNPRAPGDHPREDRPATLQTSR